MYDLFNKSQSDIENLQDYNNQLAINIYNLTKIIVFFLQTLKFEFEEARPTNNVIQVCIYQQYTGLQK